VYYCYIQDYASIALTFASESLHVLLLVYKWY